MKLNNRRKCKSLILASSDPTTLQMEPRLLGNPKWRDYAVRTSRIDVNYAENSFLELKINYFLELSYQKERKLIVWGAGTKGKKIAHLLIDKKMPFDWICDNPKKIGKVIYGQTLKPVNYLSSVENPQCIISVANREAQLEIKQFLKSFEMSTLNDYFFFC